MRWKSHKLTTGAVVYAVTGSCLPTLMAILGSLVPDLLEMGIVRHRTFTHWPPPWIGFVVVSYGACWLSPKIWLYLCFYICIGALLHLGEDYLSITGIPFRSPGGPPRGAKLYSTGTTTETILVLSITAPLMGFIWMRGFLSLRHLTEEMKKMYSLIALFWR
ncbi:hypothetical protein SAMN06269301_0857 [Geobacter sp. DSM 9736]|nr:hypothetical protein SAMN06269301_0857 [Geobacter sp. DSM 9736]